MNTPIVKYKKLIKANLSFSFYRLIVPVFCLGFITLFWNCASTSKQSTSNFNNYSYEYENNSPIIIKHTAAFNENEYKIYLSVNVRRLRMESDVKNFYKNIKIGYRQRFEYSGENIVSVDSIPVSIISTDKVNNAFICSFKISRNSSFPPYLFIDVSDKKTDFKVTEDILLESEGKPVFWTGILYNLSDSVPVFDDFIIAGNKYKILQEGPSESIYVNLIKHEFPPAPAPMSTSSRNVPKKLEIDSIYVLSTNQEISFDTAGLYLIQKDTANQEGLGFRVETGKYPKYTKLDQLIKSLVYISTTEEIRALTKSTEPKQAFDRYWLKHGGNANDGKRLIKIYYDRVEAANQKFTGYKEGWKTDMGMIFMIFGQPTYVYRNGEQEQWVYEKTEGMSQLKFTFVKTHNLYSNNHHELIRYPEYEEYWYKKVDLWRKGVPEI
ncbi:MAG TPA: GWxTD domain-containing protein [Cytophagales bacterium]|nr:GWxTD domain-containing protein [Cytophagales bacterium]